MQFAGTIKTHLVSVTSKLQKASYRLLFINIQKESN